MPPLENSPEEEELRNRHRHPGVWVVVVVAAVGNFPAVAEELLQNYPAVPVAAELRNYPVVPVAAGLRNYYPVVAVEPHHQSTPEAETCPGPAERDCV